MDKTTFSDWVEQVITPDYKARHEFMQVGVFAYYVMAQSV